MNKIVLIVVVILVVIVGGYFFLQRGYQAPAPTSTITAPTTQANTPAPEATTPAPEGITAPASAVKEFTVSGTEFSLSPSSISVKSGERARIIFKNTGRAPHNLVIEGLGVGTKTIGGGQTETIEFTASTPGTYPIFCSVPGHRASGMEGKLIVE